MVCRIAVRTFEHADARAVRRRRPAPAVEAGQIPGSLNTSHLSYALGIMEQAEPEHVADSGA